MAVSCWRSDVFCGEMSKRCSERKTGKLLNGELFKCVVILGLSARGCDVYLSMSCISVVNARSCIRWFWSRDGSGVVFWDQWIGCGTYFYVQGRGLVGAKDG